MDKHKQQLVENCKDSIIHFWKVCSYSTFYLDTPNFHYEVEHLLLSPDKQGCIIAPRSSAKSTLGTAGVMHHCTFDEGDKLVIIQSKTRPEAINRLTKIKKTLDYSENFIAMFGECGEKRASVWREDKIQTVINGFNVTIRAIGTGQPVRGALEGDTRITYYLLDDPEDEDNTKTPEALAYNFDKFLGGIAGLDKRNGKVRVIGTPICGNCIVDKIGGAKGWTTLHFDAGDSQDNLLWEQMWSYQWLEDKKEELKELGMVYKFYSEWRCQIIGSEEQLFKPDYMNYYDGYLECKGSETYMHITEENKEQIEEKIIPVMTYIGVDPASSVERGADYTVIFPIGYDAEENIYCLPYFRKRIDPTETVDEIFDIAIKYQIKGGGVEKTGYQEYLRSETRKQMNVRNYYIPGFEKNEAFMPREKKEKRLSGLHRFFYRRKVWIQKDMKAFIDELFGFPRGLKHDDLLDGFWYATRRMYPPTHQVPKKNDIDDLDYFIFNINNQSNWKVA